MRFRVPDRDQVVMGMASLDELIGAEHPARVIWAVVGRLDLSRFYEPVKARAGVAGRDPTDPRLLISLWLYAHTEGEGSAREVARLCMTHDAYKWLCGGVSMNHHTLSDFRVDHGQALDELFTQVLTMMLDQKLVSVHRISHDGTRVRACAGSSSFRRKDRLLKLQEQVQKHVAELKSLIDDPETGSAWSARRKAAAERAARERAERIERALAQLPGLQRRQAKLSARKSQAERTKLREPRASTTDAEARVMRMPDGGYRPAMNVQLASDPDSRAILGVEVTNQGTDTGELEPMQKQVELRTGQTVREHLADGGYLRFQDIEQAEAQRLTLYVPPKPPREPDRYGDEYQPRDSDSEAVKRWRQRMGKEESKTIYKQRAATSETINADLKTWRGLTQLSVRGLAKARCIALWCALAYNLMHFGAQLAA
jgi:transposase